MKNRKLSVRRKKYNNKYYKNNRTKILKQKKEYYERTGKTKEARMKQRRQDKKYRQNHKNKIAKRGKKYRKLHVEAIKRRMKRYNRLNRRKIAKRTHEYYLKHKEQLAKKRRANIKKNKKRLRKQQTEYQRNRRHTDIQYKLSEKLRNRIKASLQGNPKVGSAVEGLRCTLGFLIAYIQSKFYDGMTWDNWGKVWELDHIVPLWKFDLTNKKQFRKAVCFTNLQPLTIPDHKKKTAKEATERQALRIRK